MPITGATICAAALIRPWLFLGPAMIILAVYLVYPVIETLRLSFFDKAARFRRLRQLRLGLRRPRVPAARSSTTSSGWSSCRPLCTFFGLVIAVLTDRIWWGNIAKSLIFMPMAISFVGASVIWKFIYDYRGEGRPRSASSTPSSSTSAASRRRGSPSRSGTIFFLMVILIWIQTGFAMVILSAALRGIPEETIEAARHRRRQRLPDLLQHHGAADLGHHRRGVDDDHHHGAQGVRHRARHDQRPVEHARCWPT